MFKNYCSTIERTLSKFLVISNYSGIKRSTAQIHPSLNKNDYFSFKIEDGTFVEDVINNFKIIPTFLTEEEEDDLMKDVEPKLRRQKYQFDHWDDAIHGFKETETVNWSKSNSCILQKLCNLVFSGSNHLPHTHILDLAEDGYIKPHVDSIRYCGDTIAGISLLSDSVMRLVHTEQNQNTVDILLPRRSLYIMTGTARFNYTHEILSNSESNFKGNKIHKLRRVSIICRNSPKELPS